MGWLATVVKTTDGRATANYNEHEPFPGARAGQQAFRDWFDAYPTRRPRWAVRKCR
jgi:hypothetical protein